MPTERTLRDTTRRVIGFPDKYAAFRHVVSLFSFLPALRGLWTANHHATNGDWEDWTKYDLLLTAVHAPPFNYGNLEPYFGFDGTNDYFTRADDAATSITGTEAHIANAIKGLTLGQWFFTSDLTTSQYIMAKLGAAGNYSYGLTFQGAVAGDPMNMLISDDGTNVDDVASSNAVSLNWNFTVGRFNDNDAGEELAIFLNGVKTTDTTARASIFDGNGAFTVGSAQGGLSPLVGGISIAFLCACALSDDMIGALFQQSRALYGV